MIAQLNGNLIFKKAPWIVLDVNGVGYEIQVPMTVYFALPELQTHLALFTHYVVREDGHWLYGFLTPSDRDLFRTIVKVSGIGPKVALSILSTIPAADFTHYIDSGQTQLITQVPGIGKKTAERLVIELRDKLKSLSLTSSQSSAVINQSDHAQLDAIEALVSLGFSLKEAKAAVHKANKYEDSEMILRDALQGLAK